MRPLNVVFGAAMAILVAGPGIPGNAAGAPAMKAPAKATRYTCPMHPQIRRDKPGDCPICGMRLVPVREAAPSGAKSAKPEQAPVAGRASVRVPASQRSELGVRTVRVGTRELVHTVRAPGRIAHDPELYSALVEYRAAADALKAAGSDRARAELQPAFDAVKLRLAHFGIDPGQADDLASPDKAEWLILPGDHVWVYASVFEPDLPWIRTGQSVRVTVPAIPGETFEGQVRAIDPVLDPMTRTATVRLIVANPKGRNLRLEMYVQVGITSDRGEGLAIPEDAVIDTGTRRIVFVSKGEDLIPREVRLGPVFDGGVQVLGGVSAGDEVVTGANFLIDADSRLSAAAAEAADAAGTASGVSPDGETPRRDVPMKEPKSGAGGMPPMPGM